MKLDDSSGEMESKLIILAELKFYIFKKYYVKDGEHLMVTWLFSICKTLGSGALYPQSIMLKVICEEKCIRSM